MAPKNEGEGRQKLTRPDGGVPGPSLGPIGGTINLLATRTNVLSVLNPCVSMGYVCVCARFGLIGRIPEGFGDLWIGGNEGFQLV